jgi:uncharacterized protein YaaN involved in tellurite resistance
VRKVSIIDLVNETFNQENDECKLNESKDIKHTIQYNHTAEDTLKVYKNPEEYIIPEELPACKMLWDRGIETYMCGNYDDKEYQGRWIGISADSLNEENKFIFDELIKRIKDIHLDIGIKLQSHLVIIQQMNYVV